jgi:hypothetical protein
MKKNCGAMLILRYSVLLALVLYISACATKVIDISKSIPRLDLSEEQGEVVEPKMAAIKEIVDTYNAEKEALEEEFSSMMGGGRGGMMGGDRRGMGGGGRSGLREKIQEFGEKREAYLSAINQHIADIKAVLNEEQLAKFEKMKLPELEMPERPQRGGRGGMIGGGGGRRGGGMF